jgi:hypothetical protein
MRKYVGLTIGLAALCVVAAQPAFAVCGGGAGILRTAGGENGTSNIFSNPNWCSPTATYCMADVGPALSPSTRAFYWALDTGDPTVGAGDDNGTHGGGFSNGGVAQGGCGDEWICTANADNATFSYPGLLTGGYGSTSEVDGCGVGAVGSERCTCVLITDEWNGVGYFLIASARNAAAVFDFTQPGNAPLQLVPIPAPGITGTQRLQPSLDVESTVKLAAPASGVYLKDGCDCAPTGFKVLETITGRMDPAPVSRAVAQWDEPNRADGSPQPAAGSSFGTGMANGVSVRSSCGAMDTNVYLATQLLFPRGYAAPLVSGNSGRIECGPNLATPAPDRPARPADRQQGGRVPIGRQGR